MNHPFFAEIKPARVARGSRWHNRASIVARSSVFAFCLVACTGEKPDSPAAGGQGEEAVGTSPRPDGGLPPDQDSGTSWNVLCSAQDCEAQAEWMLRHDLGLRATPRPQFVSAECVDLAAQEGPSGDACRCNDNDSGLVYIGPRAAGCIVYGHGGACLWRGSDMPEECNAEACDVACAELSDRFAEDDEIIYSFTLRYAACVNHRCESVAEIGDSCYASSDLRWGQAQDCSLSNSEIIRNARAVNDDEESLSMCDEASACSKAYGCRMGACFSCNDSAQCTTDEDCVNGLCVLTAAVECHADDDCENPEQRCLLVGVQDVDDGPGRGNADLRAECAEPD